MYIWTEKAENLNRADGNLRKAGEIATLGGRPLSDGQLAATWEKRGYVRKIKK